MEQKKYFAFISYKREDEKWAKWLQHELEHYRLPLNIRKANASLPKEIRPIFKDTSELAAGVLANEIHDALENSKYLIVVCSPRSSKSEWVGKEVQTFIDMGRSEYIIPFIIAGKAFSDNPEEECFPLSLREMPKESELLGVNINEMGRDAAVVKVVARMFGLQFDTLWQRREREKRIRRNRIIAAAAVFVLAVMGVAGWIWHQNVELREKDWKLMEGQARMVAEKAREEVKKGNVYDSMLALLEMVPVNGNRPEVPEVEASLRIAYDSLCRRRWNYRLVRQEQELIHAYFSADDKYVIGESADRIHVYEARTLSPISSIIFPDSLDYYFAGVFLSSASDTLYVTDGKDANCYTFPYGQYIKRIPFTQNILNQYMTNNIEDFRYKIGQRWACLEKWLDSVGLPQDTEIEGICPAKSLIAYKRVERITDNIVFYSMVLYDYKRKETVYSIDNGGKYFNIVDLDISGVTFSPDGNFLVLSLIRDCDDKNLIVSLSDFSTYVIHCGEMDCSHYSNWLSYGRNGNLLHSSMFEGEIKVFNTTGTMLLDSIYGENDNINDFVNACMASKGDMCLVQDQEEWCVYYKYNPSKIDDDTKDFHLIEGYNAYVHISDTVVNDRYHILCDEGKIKCTDLKGEKEDWTLQFSKMWLDIKGFIQDNRYMIVYKEGFRGAYAGVYIVDTASGIIVYDFDALYTDLYYNGNQFACTNRHEENSDRMTCVNFMPFDTLLDLCREATKGMRLTENLKKSYNLYY